MRADVGFFACGPMWAFSPAGRCGLFRLRADVGIGPYKKLNGFETGFLLFS
ncbi:MAG: hypothetical protein FWC62_01490 [Firmicutes bacterium]|nr:hypothetical protein [Bacillota bacterium]